MVGAVISRSVGAGLSPGCGCYPYSCFKNRDKRWPDWPHGSHLD